MWLISTMHFQLRKLQMCMHCIRPWFLRIPISFPVQLVSRMLSTSLSNRLLLALEVAIEYWLALAFSMESKSASGASSTGPQEEHVQLVLQAEMEDQHAEVWQFINDRCGPVEYVRRCGTAASFSCAGVASQQCGGLARVSLQCSSLHVCAL